MGPELKELTALLLETGMYFDLNGTHFMLVTK
jgi:hypothetical protein